jgi:hypothetical protein
MAKKQAKSRLPKRIAGMKVPKRLRQGNAGDLLASPVGLALLAETILLVGERLVDRGPAQGKAGRSMKGLRNVVKDVRQGGADVGEGVTGAGAAVVYALGEAAKSFTDALHNARDRDQHVWDSAAERDEEAAREKKARKSVEGPGPEARTH